MDDPEVEAEVVSQVALRDVAVPQEMDWAAPCLDSWEAPSPWALLRAPLWREPRWAHLRALLASPEGRYPAPWEWRQPPDGDSDPESDDVLE